MSKISKNEILKLLKQYNINEASMEQSDASIKVYIDFSKQTMNKQPTIRELILNVTSEVKEMKSDIKQLKTEMLEVKEDIKHINGRLDNIEVRLDHVEEQQKEMKNDIKILKVEMTKVKTNIKQIKNCPTIKKELGL